MIQHDRRGPIVVGLDDKARKSMLPCVVYQVLDQLLANTHASMRADDRHPHQLSDAAVLEDECPRSNHVPTNLGDDEDMAAPEIVGRDVIDVRVQRLVDGAEVLAKASEDQAASRLLVGGFKRSDDQTPHPSKAP